MTDSDPQANDARLLDQLCDEFEESYTAAGSFLLEDFLNRVAPELRSKLLPMLIEVEIELLDKRGELPSQDEYAGRFQIDSNQVVLAYQAAIEKLSSTNNRQLKPDLVDKTQSLSESAAESLRRAWQSMSDDGIEPQIADFIPYCPDEEEQDEILYQLFIADIECRISVNREKELTDYIKQFPDDWCIVRSAFKRASANGAKQSKTVSNRNNSTIPQGRNPSAGIHPSVTSRYEKLEKHAEGGLGVVYRAKDQELNRTVALKEIRDKHANKPVSQSRFLFEAEVTGSLEHPGIVPVYGLGQYEDKRPYYAMRMIRGGNFRDAIASFHDNPDRQKPLSFFSREFRSLLLRFVEACNAIHYAHEHGVLHRDIKPSNIMLGKYGETLVVDWGLAKVLDPKNRLLTLDENTSVLSVSSGDATMKGSAVGTPQYMSPEQARGDHDAISYTSDVYSLGAVLFSILTGQGPINSKDPRVIVMKAQNGEVQKVDELKPNAPGALVSIVEMAMSLDPSDRYDTAVDLANDIDLWLSDEAVKAHLGRESVFEKSGRLLRRYRSWTISGAASLLVLAMTAVVAAILINSAKNNERVAKIEAQQSKQEAVARYRDSREAIDTWLVQSSDVLEYFPATRSIRSKLLQLAIDDYEKLSKQVSQDPELEFERANALVRLGQLQHLSHNYEAAASHFDAALQVLETPVDDPSMSARYKAEHGNVHTEMGLTLAAQEKYTEAEEEFALAVAELTGLVNEIDSSIARRRLASAYVNSAHLSLRLSETDKAIDRLQTALQWYGALGNASDSASELGIARTYELLGRTYAQQGQHDKAIASYEQASEQLIPLVREEPDHPAYLNAIASVHNSHATSLRTLGFEKLLFDALESSVGSYRALQRALPDVYDEQLASSLTNLGLAKHEAGFSKKAEEDLSEAKEILEDLNGVFNGVEFQSALATCMDALGQVQLDVGTDPKKAERLHAVAFELFKELAFSHPMRADFFVERLAIAQSHHAQTLHRLNVHEAAEKEFAGAITHFKELIDSRGRIPAYVNAMAHIHHRLAYLLWVSVLGTAS